MHTLLIAKALSEVTAHDIRSFAVAAEADPRSVRKVLRGDRLRGPVDRRIRRVLAEAGVAVGTNDAPKVQG
jgi:translation initiation factor 2 alpha subunit (eIF-2alpha)